MDRRCAFVLLAGVLGACADLELPGDGASAAEVRSYCRSSTSAERAAELDRPGVTGPVRAGTTARPSDAAFQNCLRRYGVTP